MAHLSDSQLASLLDEIACSMRAGTPIVESMQRLQDRRLGGIAKASAMIAAGLTRGENLAASVAAIESPMSSQAAAAVEACQQSGDSELLARMADQLRQRAEYSRSCRLAWIYPLLLMAVGYAIGVLVMGPMIRRFQGREMAWPAGMLEAANWLESNWYLPPAVMLAVLIVVLLWLFSRHRFPRDIRLRLFCQSLSDQIQHNIPEDVAIRTAAKMSGDESLGSISQPTLRSPQVQKILAKSELIDIEGVGAQETLIAQLRYVASLHAEQARRRSFLWSRLIPRVAMVVIGGGFILFYTLWVIAPVYQQVAQW